MKKTVSLPKHLNDAPEKVLNPKLDDLKNQRLVFNAAQNGDAKAIAGFADIGVFFGSERYSRMDSSFDCCTKWPF